MHQKTAEAVEALEKLVLYGDVGGSGFLPAERELCRQLRIGRGALQSVLAELIRRGYICRIPGKGIKILARDEESSWKKLLVVIQEKSLRVTEQFEILRGIAEEAEEHAAEIVLFFNKNDFIDRRLAAKLEDEKLSGVIFVEKFPPRIREAMNDSALPCVTANFEESVSAPAVRVDYRQLGRLAGRYLVEKGHKRIGFIGGKHDTFIYREMFAGLKGALAEDDLKPDPALTREIDYRFSDAERKAAVMEMLRDLNGQGAVFAGRDHWARLIFECCRELGIRIPEQLSVIGNDNVSWSGAAAAGLSSFTQPTFETGRMAVKLLCQACDTAAPVGTVMLTGEFIERNSVQHLL